MHPRKTDVRLVLALLALASLVAACHGAGDGEGSKGDAPKEMHLLYMADIGGEIEPCG